MGLLSSVKKTVGAIKNKAASALSGITKGKATGMASKVGLASKAIPAVRAISIGTTAYKAANKLEAVRTNKKTPKAVKAVLGAALLGSAAVGVEKIAEKLGIRGGAGFIGKAKRKRKGRKSRYMTIRVPRNRRGEGSISKSEERRLRRTARNYSYSDGSSRRSRRKKSFKSNKARMKWVRSHRRKK